MEPVPCHYYRITHKAGHILAVLGQEKPLGNFKPCHGIGSGGYRLPVCCNRLSESVFHPQGISLAHQFPGPVLFSAHPDRQEQDKAKNR